MKTGKPYHILRSPTPELSTLVTVLAPHHASFATNEPRQLGNVVLGAHLLANAERTGITKLLSKVAESGLVLQDVATRQSSLEDIFVDLLKEDAA